MIRQVGDEGFMIFWHTELLMGWIVCRKQSVEKPIKFASAYETDVANLHGLIRISWTWSPQGMSVCRIPDRKLFAEDVVVGHWDRKDQGKLELSTPVASGGGEVRVEDVADVSRRRARVSELRLRRLERSSAQTQAGDLPQHVCEAVQPTQNGTKSQCSVAKRKRSHRTRSSCEQEGGHVMRCVLSFAFPC